MKRMLAWSTALGILGAATISWSFLDELLAPKPDPKPAQQERRAEPTQPKGLLEGVGGLLGAKEKDIDLIKKGLKTVQSLQPIGIEEELAIGQAVAVEAFSRFGGEYQSESLATYVNLVGRTVADVSDRPELTYRFAILDSREQNAFAAPGGYIFVTIGLLRTLKNEAELAGVLAHEVAHVTRKHMLTAVQRSALLANVSDFSLSVMDKDPEMFSNVINATTELLFDKGLDKDLEFEADLYGIEYAYRAGYHPRGLADYLTTLRGQEGRAVSRFFSTHPPTSDRLRRANDILGEYGDGSSLPFLADRFKTRMRST